MVKSFQQQQHFSAKPGRKMKMMIRMIWKKASCAKMEAK